MALTVNTNVASLNVQKNLGKASDALANAMTRLSSGLRISSASDATPNTLITQGLNIKSQAISTNLRDLGAATSFNQTAEGGLNEVTNILTRMRSLAANQTASGSAEANSEFQNLQSELMKIGQSSTFNGINLFSTDGSSSNRLNIAGVEFDKNQIALVGSGDPEDGILTRSYNGYAIGSESFNISSTNSLEQRNGVTNAIDQMISNVTTARFALATFQTNINNKYNDLNSLASYEDAGLYTAASRPTPSIEVEELSTRQATIRTMVDSVFAQQSSVTALISSLMNR